MQFIHHILKICYDFIVIVSFYIPFPFQKQDSTDTHYEIKHLQVSKKQPAVVHQVFSLAATNGNLTFPSTRNKDNWEGACVTPRVMAIPPAEEWRDRARDGGRGAATDRVRIKYIISSMSHWHRQNRCAKTVPICQ